MNKESSLYRNLILEKDNLFSFYLIFGSIKSNEEVLKEFLRKEIKFSFNNNIDFFDFNFEVFKIDDAKKIQKLQINKNTYIDGAESKQIFFIKAKDINIYAQNSLLKMLEEPAKNTYFFIFLESDFKILPTLLSRARTFKIENNNFPKTFLDFLKASFTEREKIIKKMDENQEKIIWVSYCENYFLDNKNYFLDNFFNINEYNNFEKSLLELKRKAQTEGLNISNILNYLAIKFPRIEK